MKSKLHLRRVHTRNPNHTTEVEVEVTDQYITGVLVITQGGFGVQDYFPRIGWNVKLDLSNWCNAITHHVKLPNEPESAYRHIENMAQLGDALGCGQVD